MDDPEQRPKVQCAGTKRNGEQCGAWAVHGKTHCAGHSGLGIAADPQGYGKQAAAISGEARSRRAKERRMSLLDHLAVVLERDAEQIALELRTAGRGGDWRATEALITRVHGKPVEKVQQVDADPLDVASMSPEQRAALMARVLEDHPGLAVLIPRTPGVQPAPLDRMDTGTEG